MATSGGTRAAAAPSTTSTSRPPPSLLDVGSDEALHMSRSYDAAARLGKLSISGSSSSRTREEMPVTTREQRRRGHQQQPSAVPSSSRAAASSSGTPRQTAPPSRVQPERRARNQPYPPGRQDNDGEELEDSDPNEEDDGEGEDQDNDHDQGNVDDPAIRRRDAIIHAMAMFDPNLLSGPELMGARNQLPETSRQYRDLIVTIIGFNGTIQDATRLHDVFPIDGPFFATRLLQNLRERYTRNLNAYDNGVARHDAIATLKAFQSIYTAIRDVFRSARLMGTQAARGIQNDCKSSLILLLLQILDAIVRRADDNRTQTHTGQVYAGGTLQYEYNLWRRFSTYPDEWEGFVDVLNALRELPQAVNFFQANSRQLSATLRIIHDRHPGWTGLDQSQFDLVSRLRGMI